MKKLIVISFAVLITLGACDLTKLNKVTKSPVDVGAGPLFSNSIVNLSDYFAWGGTYGLLQSLAEHWTATSYTNVVNYKLDTYSLPNNTWTVLYSDVLNNLKKAKEKIQDDNTLSETNKKNDLACIQVIEVWAYSTLVNTFGNIPYSQALDPETTHPELDDAKTVYLDLISRLNKAIANFELSGSGFGSADIIYQGDIGEWVKLANSLKMRLAITIADVDKADAKKAIEQASPNAFSSNADNAIVHYQTSPPNTNPVWDNLVQSGRHDNVPAKPLISRMNKLNDPRRGVFFTKHNGSYVGGPYGVSNNFGDYSHFSERIKKKDRPQTLLGYDEVEFIRAEAAARGYDINGTASKHYKKAIRADMEYWGVSDAKINKYLTQPNVAWTSAKGDFRQKIALQKWIALFTQGMQAWTEVRRLDAPQLKSSPNSLIDGAYIMRFKYPSDVQNLNEENYNKAADAIGGDKLTTKIFWDVK
jgi:hypothetical protein